MDVFGKIVKQARLSKNKKQKEVAHDLGCTAAYLGRIENKGEIPAPHFTVKLAEYYCIAVPLMLERARLERIAKFKKDLDLSYTLAYDQFKSKSHAE